MRNWIIVLLIFVMPLGLYAYLDAKAQNSTLCKVEEENAIPKPKILKFSSPMCSECQEVALEIKKAMKDHKDSVLVEEINVIENNGKGTAYTKSQIKKYKVTLVPTLVFIDKDGKVVHKQEGLISSDEIISLLDEME